jgi:hypothetical protein
VVIFSSGLGEETYSTSIPLSPTSKMWTPPLLKTDCLSQLGFRVVGLNAPAWPNRTDLK